MDLPDGRQVREYPRLRYGGAHLKNPDLEFAPDVTRRAVAGIAGGVVGWVALATLIAALLARRRGLGIDEE